MNTSLKKRVFLFAILFLMLSATNNNLLTANAQDSVNCTDHIWNSGEVTVPATCVSMGKTTYTCTVEGCGAIEIRTDIPIDPDNHMNTENVEDTYSTCISAGYTTGVYCVDCGKYISGHEEKPLAEHSWYLIDTVKPTCISDGYVLYACALKSCTASKREILSVVPDAHTLKETVYPPTCTEEGYTQYTCKLCRYGYVDDIKPPLGHFWESPVWEWNGVSAAFAIFVCRNGDHPQVVKAEIIKQTVFQPTSTENGLMAYTAVVDFEGETYTDTIEQSVPPLGGDICKWCGAQHTEDVFQKLTFFFHNILYFFSRLVWKQ